MKIGRAGFVIGMAVLAGLVLAPSVRGDFYMKEKRHTSAISTIGPAEPAKDSTVVTWLTDDKARMDFDDGSSWLYFIKKKIMIRIDHTARQYTESRLDFGISFGGAGGLSAHVKETDETRTIGDWTCRKYVITMTMGPLGTTTTEAWAAEELKLDYAKVYAVTKGPLAVMPGFKSVLKEMKKVRGMVVFEVTKSKSPRRAFETTTELLECVEKDAPAGTFEVPAGYKKVESIGG